MQDLRFGLRLLVKSLGFTSVAVLTLGLGIGATTAIFSVANAVLLRPLPYPESERLVHPVSTLPARGITRGSIPYADFHDWRAGTDLFEQIAIYARQSPQLTGEGEPERVDSLAVTEGYFELMRARPLVGRVLAAEDYAAAAGGVVPWA